MKTSVKFLIVLFFLGLIILPIFSQDVVIKTYALNDQSLSNKLDMDMGSGKSPVGFNVQGNTIQIMYLNQDLFNMNAWSIDWYGNSEEISAGITTKMQNEGYFPMGISSDNSKFYCLYIKGETNATAWQLVESNQNLDEVSHDISPYLDQGYIPVGITLHGSMYYTLLVNVVESAFTSWEIKGFQGEWNMNSDIKQKITQNKVPFGFLEKDEVYNVLYVGI